MNDYVRFRSLCRCVSVGGFIAHGATKPAENGARRINKRPQISFTMHAGTHIKRVVRYDIRIMFLFA